MPHLLGENTDTIYNTPPLAYRMLGHHYTAWLDTDGMCVRTCPPHVYTEYIR